MSNPSERQVESARQQLEREIEKLLTDFWLRTKVRVEGLFVEDEAYADAEPSYRVMVDSSRASQSRRVNTAEW